MKLLRFKASNLFSLGDVEIDLDKRGLVLITGHSRDEGGANGSGKSSLSNKGILWTLFGSTASGERADAAINRFAAADSSCSGLLDLESNSGGQFRVVRSRNPNRLTVTDLATGADISAKTEKDTQVLINKLIGRTRDTFLQTDFFGQGKIAAFLDLTPKAQVELLETILPFDRLAELADSAKEFLSKIGVVRTSVERRLNEQLGKQMEAQRQERVLSDAIDKWDDEHLAKKANLEARIAELENNTVQAKLEEWKQRIVNMPNWQECQDKLEELTRYYQSLNDLEAEYKQNQALQNGLKCPTCKQPVGDNTGWPEAFKSLQDRRNQAMAIERETINALKDLNDLKAEIDKAEASQNSGELAILRQSLEATLAEVNPYEELYQQTANTITLMTNNLSAHKARMENVEADSKALTFWRDAFGKELKAEFLGQVCPFIEKRANQHLHGLGNAQLKVSVGTRKLLKSNEERSDFTVTVASASGGAEYSSLSGGERQLVNFAMGLALADLAELQTDGPSYFMVLDEPFMALDARNSEALVGYLNSYLNGKKETILLVSNEETLKNLIPNRVNVIKENGVSRIE